MLRVLISKGKASVGWGSRSQNIILQIRQRVLPAKTRVNIRGGLKSLQGVVLRNIESGHFSRLGCEKSVAKWGSKLNCYGATLVLARVLPPLLDRISMIVLDPKQVKKTTEVSVEGPFSVHDTLREGFKSVSHDLAPKHPLQGHLKNVIGLIWVTMS